MYRVYISRYHKAFGLFLFLHKFIKFQLFPDDSSKKIEIINKK